MVIKVVISIEEVPLDRPHQQLGQDSSSHEPVLFQKVLPFLDGQVIRKALQLELDSYMQ